MFKFFAACLMVLIACAAAKPGIVAPLAYSAYTYPSAYSAYSAPLVAASPYTAAYTAGYAAAPYVASPYAAYSPYTASSVLLR